MMNPDKLEEYLLQKAYDAHNHGSLFSPKEPISFDELRAAANGLRDRGLASVSTPGGSVRIDLTDAGKREALRNRST